MRNTNYDYYSNAIVLILRGELEGLKEIINNYKPVKRNQFDRLLYEIDIFLNLEKLISFVDITNEDINLEDIYCFKQMCIERMPYYYYKIPIEYRN